MSTMVHILEEERNRLEKVVGLYQSRMAELPRGAKRIKKIRSKEYLYLTYREGAAVKTEYVAPVESENAREVLKQFESKVRYQERLKEAKQSLKEVEALLRGKL